MSPAVNHKHNVRVDYSWKEKEGGGKRKEGKGERKNLRDDTLVAKSVDEYF